MRLRIGPCGALAPRTPQLRVLLLALAALGCLGVVGSLLDAIPEHDGLTEADGPTARWFALHRSLGLDWTALHVGTVTAPLLVAGLALVASLVLWRRGHVRPALLLAAATFVAVATTQVMKPAVDRPRPLAPLNLTPETEPSFPSGHVLVLGTVVLTALVLALPVLSRRARVLACAAASAAITVVAVDRLVIDAHWLTDVVASLALAALTAVVVALVDLALRRSRATAGGS